MMGVWKVGFDMLATGASGGEQLCTDAIQVVAAFFIYVNASRTVSGSALSCRKRCSLCGRVRSK
jgi:hypothetical protein